jgi:hypothetical protein
MEHVCYGKTPSEKAAEENVVCRQIVSEINNFGVSQRQLLMIIFLLALQLENNVHMRELSTFVKELAPEAFLTGGNSG